MPEGISGGPYISFVVVSRNDDHGGDALRRTQATFSALLRKLDRRRLPSELILVDWNPVPGKPLLKDALSWPKEPGYCAVRCFVVSADIHRKFKYHDRLPIHLPAAFNLGIRRAAGEFILPNTIDHFYSGELLDFIAERKLDPNRLYRAERYDVNSQVLDVGNPDDILPFCSSHIVRKIEYIPSHGPGINPVLHTNGCGDFLLLSRNAWHTLRGIYQSDPVANHCDSLLLYQAHCAGYRELRLPDQMCVYHVEHVSGFHDPSTKPVDELTWAGRLVDCPSLPQKVRESLKRKFKRNSVRMKRVIRRGIPTLHYEDWRILVANMLAGRHPYYVNDPSWGLRDLQIREENLRDTNMK